MRKYCPHTGCVPTLGHKGPRTGSVPTFGHKLGVQQTDPGVAYFATRAIGKTKVADGKLRSALRLSARHPAAVADGRFGEPHASTRASQVSKTGSKSWIFRFTRDKKQREMGLGALHTVTLAEARERAKQCRTLLLEGRDPLDARAATKVADSLERAKMLTFDQCAAAYIAVHRTGWKNAKHAAQWESTLATYAAPVIGTLPVSDIDTALVVKVLTPIWHSKTETATRLRGRIESILDWATVSSFRVGDNRPAGAVTSITFWQRPQRSQRSTTTRPCPGPKWERL